MSSDNINQLKKKVFYDMLDLAGRVFIQVQYSEDVSIGKRGFLTEEKEKGLILVFNARMNFTWEDKGLSAKLVFGSSTEDCFIPSQNVISVFSPELHAQFSVSPQNQGSRKDDAAEPDVTDETKKDKVIRVDFKKKRH